MRLRLYTPCLMALSAMLLAGCASIARYPKESLPPLGIPPVPDRDDSALLEVQQRAERRTELRELPTPRIGATGTAVAGLRADSDLPPLPNRGPFVINIEGVPLATFANEVFGNMLGLTTKIDPEVTALEELVTVNTAERLDAAEMFLVARQVLSDYGVAVRQEGRVTRISVAASNTAVMPPLIISGRALPEVPVTHRPVFQLVEMDVVTTNDAQRWLSTIYGSEIQITEMPARNALLLSGKPNMVQQALSALSVFDRPTMRGRVSARLEPAFLPPEQLVQRLSDVLNVQGYSTARAPNAPGSVVMLPVQAANSVLLFATSQEVMDYAIAWARELDKASPTAGDQSLFYYQVRNTKAADIAAILNGSSITEDREEEAATTAAAPGAAPAAPAPTRRPAARSSRAGPLIVDEPRNALIYQGDPAQWERMQLLIRQIDRAPRQVMIEVTIAEVTLGNERSLGVSWFAKSGFGRFNGRLSSGQLPTSGGGDDDDDDSGGGSSGLTYLLDVAGVNRAALNAFANDSRVTVLSRPHLIVKSGSEANIDVGTEVPTVTMQTTSNQQTDGNTNLLQSIQYRKTGIITRIKPTVYSDSRVDLEISQEVSEALPLSAGGGIGGSPAIFNRSLNTEVSLRDGGSIVMAGLISDRQTRGNSGVPLLKDIPVLGSLFRNTSSDRSRTELVIMIVPYVIETDERIQAISNAIMNTMGSIEMPAREPPSVQVPLSEPSRPSPQQLPPPPPVN
ncbi:secretin N-terminal domain-containing protein [uncultured Luteimonas sp.]|uniref:secretin N-terminal domain-containing protein n=1 Tax=uncultured Luteimonas sp. TaxID=453144 RepID=UPI00262A2066|nr:secretin N-terminal domain-containing protein [uncultured Luteimonas sp.]